MIEISNLNFKYNNRIIFKNFNLSIKKGSFTTLLGNNGTGKSTLVRLLAGFEKSNNSISIDKLLVNEENIKSVRSKIGIVFENPDNCLISETVYGELSFPLENLGFDKNYINKKVKEISELLNIESLLEKNARNLSGGEKQLVCLGCALIVQPKIIILDEALSMIDDVSKKNILELLKKINEDFDTTIINITHDIEETLYGQDIVIIDDGKVLIHEKKENVYKQEKLLKKIGFNLPFMVDLSNRLSYYDLVDDIIYDMNEMVNLLWK